ncbi:MAG TPA: bifunctional homocysteine S-methyltransferase/methylenetetrahydrofolate reductase [Actinomycetota bacterium]|nr:bifunctional homocysteine S-methyltransferase/methylenetetrahydrofolate reductase [Actinomycetota bacterium]
MDGTQARGLDREEFRDLLAGSIVVADGGLGTSLIAMGSAADACLEAENVRRPDIVERAHRSFVEAGARLVLTNSFGANRFRLDRHGLADRVEALCVAAVTCARASGASLVAGSLGPLGVRLSPYGRVPESEAADAYAEQANALVGAGVDLLVLETQSDLREIEVAVGASRTAAPEIPLVVSATFTRDDRTLLGSTPTTVAAVVADLDVDAIGVNCGEGPAQALRIIDAMRRAAPDLPMLASPNAGGPAEVGGRLVYPATPDYVADVAAALVDAGASIVGGCCGTGPEHIRAIADAVGSRAPRPASVTTTTPAEAVAVRDRPTEGRTHLERAIARGDLVVAVEMEPPRSFNAATVVAGAATLRDAGADVIDVADSPMARMRMSAWAACRAIEERAGIETVLHFPTRGRNVLRLQGDLLGSHALGIRNLFVCVGDPVTVGEYPQTLNDVDVTATGLLSLITEAFNAGVDRAGASIGEPTAFFAGAAVGPHAPDRRRESRVLRRKLDAGARFLLSQPLFGATPLRAFRDVFRDETGSDLEVPLLAGVLPLSSARHARFLRNEVPGIAIPDATLRRIERAGDGERGWAEGLAIACETVAELRDDGVAGVYVMPQFGRYDRAAELVEAIRRMPRVR